MSAYLLDTCALLWWMADAPELGRAARRVIESPRNTTAVSAASLWEIAIKRRRGRLSGVDSYLARHQELHKKWGFMTVAIEADDAVAAGSLSLPHDDPFDRMLIVQARRLEARLVTCDDAITRHVDACVW
ncbi:MAG: type II toxin-antitoxin system VapC family toxin [Deltaproteobacteria bacterium]|nr:type II toxin-antitoxin system VapC family toxin [Deltaproteobacteria bacterium]